jgi:hypothetical protein
MAYQLNYTNVKGTLCYFYKKKFDPSGRINIYINKGELWKGGLVPFHIPIISRDYEQIMNKGLRLY